MCRSFFYAVLTYCALPITVTARSWSKNEHFSLYREKAREEKEGKHRLWERCVNRLRFSAVSIAAAREKREGGVFAQAACRRSFALPFLPEYQGLFCIIVRRNSAKVLLYPFIKVKAHGFCIGNPEPAHPVTLAGNPVLAGDSAKRVKQILVGDRNNTFLFASRLGELEAPSVRCSCRNGSQIPSLSHPADTKQRRDRVSNLLLRVVHSLFNQF